MSTQIKYYQDYPSISTIFNLFKEDDYAAFLDSSLVNELGHFSIIGIDPYLIIESSENSVKLNHEVVNQTVEEILNEQLINDFTPTVAGLPITKGALGFYSYDYGQKIMGVPTRHKDEIGMNDAIFCFYDTFIIEDHHKKQLAIVCNGKLSSTNDRLEALEQIILTTNSENYVPANQNLSQPVITTNMAKDAYISAIEKVVNYIYEGDIYVMNLTRQLQIKSDITPFDLFRKLRRINPSPFGGYLNYPEFQIVSSSPERFMKIENREITTRPIKGTRKRGQTPEEDELLRQDLVNSEKEKSELLMVVDLERNDLNKICQAGSVKVPNLFSIEPYATVFHLVADVTGTLKKDISSVDAILSASPGGSITGNPKFRAMEIIDELEESRRGLYTGSIGYFSLDGNCDFNIVIRTAVAKEGCFHLGVGGGLTYESDPDDEFEETNQKAKAIIESFKN